jgi:transposase-like protein
MRNLAAMFSADAWPAFKVRVQAAYQAPSRAIARERAAGVVADYGRKHDNAVAWLMDDFEACIAHLRFPVTHRRGIRITNLLERLFVKERRRLKTVPNAFGESAVLKLMFSALIRAAERWRSVKIMSLNVGRSQHYGTSSLRNTKPRSASMQNLQGMKPSESPATLGLDLCNRET